LSKPPDPCRGYYTAESEPHANSTGGVCSWYWYLMLGALG